VQGFTSSFVQKSYELRSRRRRRRARQGGEEKEEKAS
jgi:hypothetical protein